MISAARCPALRAPIGPTATVATGIPGGICTIERSELNPASGVAASGTPITGSVVSEASTPGKVRGGAGTGDEHSQPASGRGQSIGTNHVAGAVRRHDADLPADPVAVEHLAAGVHHGQVGLAADDDADAHGGRHARASAATGRPMSVRACIPSKCTRARLPYARVRAASTSAPIAVTQSTRPPAVRSVPSASRAVPA